MVRQEKPIAIVRGVESCLCLQVAQALYAGGVRLMEVACIALVDLTRAVGGEFIISPDVSEPVIRRTREH